MFLERAVYVDMFSTSPVKAGGDKFGLFQTLYN